MKNYGRMHRAETMYCILLPYKDAMKEDVPAKIRLMLAVNKWINPWHFDGFVEGDSVQKASKNKGIEQ